MARTAEVARIAAEVRKPEVAAELASGLPAASAGTGRPEVPSEGVHERLVAVVALPESGAARLVAAGHSGVVVLAARLEAVVPVGR